MKKVILIAVFLVSAGSFGSVQGDNWTDFIDEPTENLTEELRASDQVCGDTARFYFMGCRRAGHCLNSCPTQSGFSLNDPTGEICDASDFREGLICCCQG